MSDREFFLKDILPLSDEAEKRILHSKGISELFQELQDFDLNTYTHCENVARLSVIIGRNYNYSKEKLVRLAMSGYLHDIGKISIGIGIIGKRGVLSAEEYVKVKEHARLGYELIHPFIQDDEILHGVLEHHERINGSGYSSSLVGSSICNFAKIIGAVDVFDAMTSVRPYKQAFDCDDVLKNMELTKGFDPEVVSMLKKLYLGGKNYDIRVLE